MSTLRIPLALALSVLALALVACGEDNEYADEVANTVNSLAAELQDAGALATNATSEGEVTSALTDAESALGVAAQDLSGIEPPEDVADLNDELISLIEGYRDTVVETGDAIESGAPASELDQFATDSQTFATELDSLRDQFIEAGIPFEEGS